MLLVDVDLVVVVVVEVVVGVVVVVVVLLLLVNDVAAVVDVTGIVETIVV